MAISIKTKDGRVSIVADDGSSVSNITVAGKRIVGGPVPDTTGRIVVIVGLLVFALGVALILFGCSTAHAHASPAQCESIHSADQRHYCRAVTLPDRGECELIKDHDLRFQCRARVR